MFQFSRRHFALFLLKWNCKVSWKNSLFFNFQENKSLRFSFPEDILQFSCTSKTAKFNERKVYFSNFQENKSLCFSFQEDILHFSCTSETVKFHERTVYLCNFQERNTLSSRINSASKNKKLFFLFSGRHLAFFLQKFSSFRKREFIFQFSAKQLAFSLYKFSFRKQKLIFSAFRNAFRV